MKVRSEIISALENEYRQRRDANERLADERQREAEEKVPGLREALEERQELFLRSLRQALNHQPIPDLAERMRQKSERVEALLTGAGYARDWLDPIYTCPKCRDQGYVGENPREMCSCMRGEFYRRLESAVGLTESEEQSFDTWDAQRIPDVPVPEAQASQRQLSIWLRDECRDWAAAWPDTPFHTLVLSGESGLGKTFLLHAMAKELLRREKDVLLMSAYAVLEQARKAYFGREEDSLGPLMDTEVLMLDDFGSEPMLNNVTVEQFFNLFAERQRRGLATVISTNLSPAQIRDRYTERVSSRLLDSRHCLLMKFRGQDIRRPQGLKEGRGT